MTKLVISLATRGRPQQVVETIQRSIVNWTHPNTVMQVQVDQDDPATTLAIADAKFGNKVIINVQNREDTIAEKWNRALQIPADVYSIAADDDPYITPGYDSLLLEAAARFPDGIGMVYGSLANLSFTGSLSMTAKLAEKLGYIQPPLFPYWFVDHWTDDVAKIIGRIAFADIKTDQSKAGHTQEMREPDWWATFFDCAYLKRNDEAFKIIDGADFDGYKWQKNLLKNNAALIHQRSRMLNDGVRRMPHNEFALRSQGQTNSLKDERYQRVKKKAMALIPDLLDNYGMDKDMANAYRNYLLPPTTIQNLQKAFA